MDQNLKKILDSRVPTPTLNRWCSNFRQTKQYADDHGIPLIAIVSKDECPNCRVMEASLLDEVYKDWMNKSGFLFYFGHLGEKNANLASAKKFVARDGIMPMARIWWNSGGRIKTDAHYSAAALKKSAAYLKDSFKNTLADYTPQLKPAKHSVTPTPDRDQPASDQPQSDAIRQPLTASSGQALKTMFGLGRDCIIITKDNKILQYQAGAQRIILIGDYNPTGFLAVAPKIL